MGKLLFGFVLLLSISSYAKADIRIGGKDYPTINGAQVFVMDSRYKTDVGAFFKEAKSKGIDTVFFRVFHNLGDRAHFGIKTSCSSGVYFQTDELCVVNDLLAPVAKAARRNGIKIYAWMATRSLSELKTADNMSLSFSPSGGKEVGYGANIFKPDVRQSIVRLFKDLAAYDIDGILFQDDFIIKYSEGADDYATSLFEKETGLKVKSDTLFSGIKEYNGKKTFTGLTDLFYIWADWKATHMAKFFKELKKNVMSVNPSIRFAANIYYETPIYPKQGLAWYSQRIDKLLNAGADYLAVMGYVEQISSELKLDNKRAAAFIGSIGQTALQSVGSNKGRVIMKLQTLSFNKSGVSIPDDVFYDVCNNVTGNGLSLAVVPIFSADNIRICR